MIAKKKEGVEFFNIHLLNQKTIILYIFYLNLDFFCKFAIIIHR